MSEKQTCERCGYLADTLRRVRDAIARNNPRIAGAVYMIDTALTDTPAPEDVLVTCKLCGEQHGRDFCPTLNIELHE